MASDVLTDVRVRVFQQFHSEIVCACVCSNRKNEKNEDVIISDQVGSVMHSEGKVK